MKTSMLQVGFSGILLTKCASLLELPGLVRIHVPGWILRFRPTLQTTGGTRTTTTVTPWYHCPDTPGQTGSPARVIYVTHSCPARPHLLTV